MLLLSLMLLMFGCGKKETQENASSNVPDQTKQQQVKDNTTQAGQQDNQQVTDDTTEAEQQDNQQVTGDEVKAENGEIKHSVQQSTDNPSAPSSKPVPDDTKQASNQQPAQQGATQQSAKPGNSPTNQPAQPQPEDQATSQPADKPAVSEKTPFESYLEGLPARLNPANAEGVTCTYQFNITDGHPGLYWVSIKDGKCTTGKGAVDSPSIKINVGEQLWLDIAADKVNGTMAYLSKKFTAEGNTDYLSNMKKYFTK
ncbi:SCP-2 sterol transfer family protein [Desulfotomaculum arcticum]|uniref:SCP-2 sterol transfer family protein n=1 Tax=Desulfotruncus arcticus DSM 17038 TaxID=1121424 RepID=A0A1I2WYR7_9FIRM|nr:SCP2 sterol-binding domain-containing protein [Desulfotruncus arcticus]SFH06440.1 SCP-2 sterol transfer family protein [Desulfotomaculum arcticum] [Desulfotruncus arcticus DSM 17038]